MSARKLNLIVALRALWLSSCIVSIVVGPASDAFAQIQVKRGKGKRNTPAASARDKSAQTDAEEALPLTTVHTVCEGKTVSLISVSGMQRIEPDDVLATMKTRKGAICHDSDVQADARRLWTLGLLEDLSIDAEPQGTNVRLIVRVSERPSVRKVTFEGNKKIKDDDIKDEIKLETGKILAVTAVQDQVGKIKALYTKEGLFLARIKYELRKTNSKLNQVDVVFVIDEGPEAEVRRISFVGNKAASASELGKIVSTGETSVISAISSSNNFVQDAFDEDLTRIQAFYYDKGYLLMKLSDPRVELTADRKYVDLTIPVEEGERYRIGKVRVIELDEQGQETRTLIRPKKLAAEIKLKKGDWFHRGKIAQGIEEVTRKYRDRGYAYVEVDPQTDLHEQQRVVDLTIAIRRGPLVHIERINIRGNDKTRDAVVRREFRISEGDLYNQTKVERGKDFVNQLGYFERVELSESKGSAPDQMVINVEVTERSTGQFQVGAGFSSLESFVLTAQVQQQNLLGRGQSLGLNVQLSGIRQQFQLNFMEPWFLGTELSLGFGIFKTIQEFSFFREDSTGGNISVGYPIFDPRFRILSRYEIENVKISRPRGGLLGIGGGELQDINTRRFLANLFRDGITSSLTFGLSWDNRDNRLITSDGQYASYSIQIADSVFGSDNIYTRQTAFARLYKKLVGSMVLKLNLETGLITSRDPVGVPGFEKYFLGGIYNIRGYDLQSIGPHARLPLTGDPDAFVDGAVGGNFQAFYNVELEFPIVKQIGIRGVLFTDGGNAWNLDYRDNSGVCQFGPAAANDPAREPCGLHPNLRYSWGFGVRWFSPLGPLRFEWGIPIKRRPDEEKVRFEFTIGNSF